MSKEDSTILHDENIHESEYCVSDTRIYKNLRRRSVVLTLILMLILPSLIFFFCTSCTSKYTIAQSLGHVFDMIRFDLDCLAIVLGWLLVQAFFIFSMKNKIYLQLTRTNDRLNGIIAFLCSLGGIYLLNRLNIIHASYVYDNVNKILIASILVCCCMSILLFIKGSENRYSKQINPIVAFFYGTDINMTIGDIDLKLFLEYRIGLIGWACLNFCFFLKTMESYVYYRISAFNLIATQQILHALQLIWYEDDHRSNKHRRKETVGFIHVFGSLCWFPILWSLPCQYLTSANYPMKKIYAMGSIIFFIIGIIMYRESRIRQEILRKQFKRHAKSVESNDDGTLLTTSCFSFYRHPHYLGYALMLMSWSVPCGSTSIAWILPIYYLTIIYHKSHLTDFVSH